MASFLFSNTNFEALNNYEQIELLIVTISSDYYDIALDILMKKPELAMARLCLEQGCKGCQDWR
ncbi:ankyrin repeat-containing protein [Cucumis melo var. makuwa]|uniref:Ankyrin repeat-containing protein n=1 Tax=Cucumis melo var. makuwa TaxID=1194695 RepID=A0A5A7UIC4_CUCMM|nr:ankyrin repeat-containing protein [Cucumis melo var. makuwa]